MACQLMTMTVGGQQTDPSHLPLCEFLGSDFQCFVSSDTAVGQGVGEEDGAGKQVLKRTSPA